MNIKIKWKDPENPGMRLETGRGVPYLVSPELEAFPWLCHGFSTRLGGVSTGVLSSLNLSYSRGDERENVTENFRRIAKSIGIPFQNIVLSAQTHTDNVRIVTEADCGNGITRDNAFSDVDGMITNEPGVVLTTFFADCVPLFLVNPVKKCIGLVHSGWRGTVQKIGRTAAELMEKEFQSDPSDLLVLIGPSICRECYEVSGDVAEKFDKAFPGLSHQLYDVKENGKYQLDLWEANRRIFMEAGVPEKKIRTAGICTCCNPDLLYSHRASRGQRGTLGAFLCIK